MRNLIKPLQLPSRLKLAYRKKLQRKRNNRKHFQSHKEKVNGLFQKQNDIVSWIFQELWKM